MALTNIRSTFRACVRNCLRYFNFSYRTRVGNRSLRIPVIGGCQALPFGRSQHEPWLDAVIPVLLGSKNGAFLDVGANVGQTLLRWMKCDSQWPYYACEPNPHCVAYLNRLKNVNKLQQVHVVPVGLSDCTRVVPLFLSSDHDSAASVVKGFREPAHYSDVKYVPVFRGDDIVRALTMPEIAVVKIDVEGGELEVLTGLKRTITEQRPFIVCEVLPIYDASTSIGSMRRKRCDDIIALLADWQYDVFRLLHAGSLERLQAIQTHSDLNLCDYLFAPTEMLEAVEPQLLGDAGQHVHVVH